MNIIRAVAVTAFFLAFASSVSARTTVRLQVWGVHQYEELARGATSQMPVPADAKFHDERWVYALFPGKPVTRNHAVTTRVVPGQPHSLTFDQTNTKFTLAYDGGTPDTLQVTPRAFGQDFPPVTLSFEDGELAVGMTRAEDGSDNALIVLAMLTTSP